MPKSPLKVTLSIEAKMILQTLKWVNAKVVRQSTSRAKKLNVANMIKMADLKLW